MAFKLTPGSGATGLGIIGGGLALAFPDQRWLGFCLIGLGLLVVLFDVRFERGHVRADGERVSRLIHWRPTLGGAPRWKHRLIFGLCASIGIVVATVAFYRWNNSLPPETRLLSTWGTQIYSCDRTQLDPKIDRPTDLATARARAMVAEDALGIHIEIQEIPSGLRLTFVPLTDNARRVFGALPNIQLEERRLGNTLIVTYFFPIPVFRNIMNIIPMEGKYKSQLDLSRKIEQIFSASWRVHAT